MIALVESAPTRRRAGWRAAAFSGAACVVALTLSSCAHRDGPGSQPSSGAAATPAQGVERVVSPPVEPAPRTWEGRLSLKLAAFAGEPASGTSMAFVLNGTAEDGRLDLSTPMGTQMAVIAWRRDEASLRTSEGSRTFTSLDELSLDVLGEALPLRSLIFWLQGLPDPTMPSMPVPVAPISKPGFLQAGWLVQTGELQDGRMLEAVREAASSRRGVSLRVRLDR